ncbi:MAG: hypothetical protein CMI36_04565 [Owenweeksia sp.]|nr:hypothetical protein [Owenweeksia sp.]MBF98244.1 hypothetical protein [Owenweeksia sp.]HBF20136.1 hypothetical protein [Cryomorphaceae bacterium]
MKNHCSQCNPSGMAQFNLTKLALGLERGHSYSFVCEGCDNSAIYKDESGFLWLAKSINSEDNFEWVEVGLEDL